MSKGTAAAPKAPETADGGFIITASGRRFYPLAPQPEDVDPFDIAHALANMCRFTGHVREFYSVAQHCVMVSEKLRAPINVGISGERAQRPLQLAGLLHDAAEAYLVDLARPIKHLPELAAFRAADAAIEAAIEQRFGLAPKALRAPEVHEVDMRALVTEARDLMPATFDWSTYAAPYPHGVTPLAPADARRAWLNAFFSLGGV